jgi:hypothetical protein
MHLLFFVTIWDIYHFFVINRGFFFGYYNEERGREREREREREWKKGVSEKVEKKKKKELLYFWVSVVNCE